MKHCIRLLSFIIVTVVLGLLISCQTAPSHISQPLPVKDPGGHIPAVIGLYVSGETRAVVLRDTRVKEEKYKFSLDIGTAIEPSARVSLAKLFSKVETATTPTDSRYKVLEVRVDSRSMIDPGPSTLSPKKAQITLACTLRSGDGTVLWEDTFTGAASRTSKAAYLSTILIIRNWMVRKLAEALGQAADEALATCLDSINVGLLEQSALFQ